MVYFGLGKRALRSDGIALIPEAEFTPDQQLKTGTFVISRIQHHAECCVARTNKKCRTYLIFSKVTVVQTQIQLSMNLELMPIADLSAVPTCCCASMRL